ncbi:HNH endonuclease [Streptomyces bauhiniae]|uniref:HNH endonuclease n=1 Tax=Streptomyces bauhiniae TaxID=2340725 RepID=UPI0035E0354A
MSRQRLGSNRRRAVKARIARRQGQRCFYCRAAFTETRDATLDHYVPYSLWHTWRISNLVLACVSCNQSKSDRLPWPLVWVLLAHASAPLEVAA